MARYTPEFLAAAQRRYEDTNDSLAAMAAEFGVSERTINRMRDRGGWKRRSEREPRELSAVRLLDDATTLLAAPRATACQPLPPSEAGVSAVERIEKLVEKEIAAEEAARAQLGRLPRTRADAERAARTLATLTQTLHALQRLRCGMASGADTRDEDYDDMPEDIDAFRNELARRIRAFVQSRQGEDKSA